jgi:hypothetical protein
VGRLAYTTSSAQILDVKVEDKAIRAEILKFAESSSSTEGSPPPLLYVQNKEIIPFDNHRFLWFEVIPCEITIKMVLGQLTQHSGTSNAWISKKIVRRWVLGNRKRL